jgi:hypothetical protein
MNTEMETIEALGRIERHFASWAGDVRDNHAAGESIRTMLRDAKARESSVELRFSLSDPMTVKLFLAVCRRYGLKPYQRPGQHRTTVMLMVPPSFSQKILVPEFQKLSEALGLYFRDITERLIESSVFRASA